MIRFAELEDIPFIMGVARQRFPDVDLSHAEAWLQTAIPPRDDMIFMRSDHGFCCCYLNQAFYEPRASLHLLLLAVEQSPGLSSEGYRLLKMMVECARSLGADFFFSVETETDFSPLAKRLGATLDMRPSYKVEIADARRGCPAERQPG